MNDVEDWRATQLTDRPDRHAAHISFGAECGCGRRAWRDQSLRTLGDVDRVIASALAGLVARIASPSDVHPPRRSCDGRLRSLGRWHVDLLFDYDVRAAVAAWLPTRAVHVDQVWTFTPEGGASIGMRLSGRGWNSVAWTVARGSSFEVELRTDEFDMGLLDAAVELTCVDNLALARALNSLGSQSVRASDAAAFVRAVVDAGATGG